MTRVLVITADFGNHDDPPRSPCGQDVPGVEWHYYTDREGEPAAAPWVTHVVQGTYRDPQLSAKAYRCTPWDVVDLDGCTDVIWTDANMQISGADFVRGALAARQDGMAVWRHPRRDCVYAEADAALGAESQGGKWEPYRAAILAQVRAYLDEGYPAHQGLYATGTVAWDLTAPQAGLLGQSWLDECVCWSPMCQLSLPVVAWRVGATIGTFPLPQLERRYRIGNRWLRIYPHRTKAPA